MAQKAWRFDKVTAWKSVKGLIISYGGAAAVIILQQVADSNWGGIWAPLIAAACATVGNAIRETIKGEKKSE